MKGDIKIIKNTLRTELFWQLSLPEMNPDDGLNANLKIKDIIITKLTITTSF